ncbi:hypothetical protein E5288_WYG008168 [Bos mutus]|uniref:Acyltransferase n=1 Tax=Bos mutus TaxID=72004 RepID=A0A6B0SE41_9CETA|nr:hypothetical protein [Bos mutus]
MVKFCWQHKFGLICSLISLDLAAIGHLPTVYILVATTSPLLCLVSPGLEDPRARWKEIGLGKELVCLDPHQGLFSHFRMTYQMMQAETQILKTKELSPEHNYLMGVHPHGLLAFGAFCNFCTEATGFSKIFPGITPHLATLSWFFKIPFIRDYLMAKGVCSVSQPAIDYLLSHGTGNLVGIVVGGVGEALQSVPNTTMLILQKRKGFVRMALQHGAHLVPTYTFGETEVYDQVLFHKDSRMYKFQSYFRQILGFYFCIFYGRGFRQGSTGLLPYPLPIVTVVGEPLPLPKIEKPSQEMVDKYHALYKKALTKLFDQHKTQYGCPETQKLLFL